MALPPDPPSPAPIGSVPAVGVDVVDLGDRRCAGKAADHRFVRRILSEHEAAAVARAPDPDVALWRHWAAKEAAFKVVSKVVGRPPPFVHAAFEVVAADAVRWEGREIPVRLEREGDALLAVGWEPADAGTGGVGWSFAPLEAVDPAPDADLDTLVLRHLHPEERPPVHSRPSALVRLAARGALARALGVDPSRVAVVCPGGPAGRTPPVARLDGGPAPADVSLSHHGRYVAWAVRTAPPAPPVREASGGS